MFQILLKYVLKYVRYMFELCFRQPPHISTTQNDIPKCCSRLFCLAHYFRHYFGPRGPIFGTCLAQIWALLPPFGDVSKTSWHRHVTSQHMAVSRLSFCLERTGKLHRPPDPTWLQKEMNSQSRQTYDNIYVGFLFVSVRHCGNKAPRPKKRYALPHK